AAGSSAGAKLLRAEEILRFREGCFDKLSTSALGSDTRGKRLSFVWSSRSAHACKTPQCQRAISVARYTNTSPRSRLDCCGFDCGSLCRQSPVNVIRPGGPHSEAGGGRTFS